MCQMPFRNSKVRGIAPPPRASSFPYYLHLVHGKIAHVQVFIHQDVEQLELRPDCAHLPLRIASLAGQFTLDQPRITLILRQLLLPVQYREQDPTQHKGQQDRSKHTTLIE
jgi:hypothetical protein